MNLTTWLTIINVALNVLLASNVIDPTIKGYIKTALDAITSAITAVNKAKLAVDPTALHQIDPVV